MAKRGSSGLSLVAGVDKPYGLTSHDVVGRARRAYGERRVGHTGTLDPAATGALILCVGPAARLDRFLTGHDKTYDFGVSFGVATDTDDAQGEVIATAPVPPEALDEEFARARVVGLVGKAKQLPPVYSAIKVDGKRAYAEARKGNVIELAPRDIEIYSAELLGIETADDQVVWRVRASVSAGTYVRSIARDLGHSLGSCAHVSSLRRIRTGYLSVRDCASLDEFEADPGQALLDPVKLLGYRFAFLRGGLARDIENGRPLPADALELFSYDPSVLLGQAGCGCTSGVVRDCSAPQTGERICAIVDNTLKAICEYDASREAFRVTCGFSVGVKRGSDI